MSQASQQSDSANLALNCSGERFENGVSQLLENIDNPKSIEEVVKSINILSEKYLGRIFLENVGKQIFTSVFPRLSSAFDDVLSRLPGGEIDVTSLTPPLISATLQDAVKIIQCIENLIRQLISIISSRVSATELSDIPALPQSTIDILTKSYGHCKNSEKTYGNLFKNASNALGVLFQKTYALQKSFGFVLSKIEMSEKDDQYEETQKSALKICEGLLGICQVISGMDNMLLGATWKLLLGFMSEFKMLLQKKLSVLPYVAILCDNARDCVKYTTQLSAHSSHLLSSGDESTRRAFTRSCKFSLFFISSLSTVIQQYGCSLCDDACRTLTRFISDLYVALGSIVQRTNDDNKELCEIETQYHSDVIIEIENVLQALVREDAFVKFFTSSDSNFGSVSLVLGISKALTIDDESMRNWCVVSEQSSTDKCPVISLINLVIEQHTKANGTSKTTTGILNRGNSTINSVHDVIVVQLCSLISCFPPSLYSSAEDILMDNLFSHDPHRNILAIDVLVLISKSSSSLCDHYFTMFFQLLQTDGVKSWLSVPLQVILKFLQRIMPNLSHELMKKINCDKDKWPANVLCPYSEICKPNFQFIFLNVCKEFSFDVNIWMEGKHRLSDLHKLSCCCEKILHWIQLVRNRIFNHTDKRQEIQKGEDIVGVAILKLWKSSSESMTKSSEKSIIVSKFLPMIFEIMKLTLTNISASEVLQPFSKLLTQRKTSILCPIKIAQLLQKIEIPADSTQVQDDIFKIFSRLFSDCDWRIRHEALDSFEVISRTSSGTCLLERCAALPDTVMRIESHLSFQALNRTVHNEIVGKQRESFISSPSDELYKSWITKQYEMRQKYKTNPSSPQQNTDALDNAQISQGFHELNKSLVAVERLLSERGKSGVVLDRSTLEEFSNCKKTFYAICEKVMPR